jgi:hypothetical protein
VWVLLLVQDVGVDQSAEGVVQEGHGRPHAVAVLRSGLGHGYQRIDGVASGGLDARDRSFDELAACLAVGGLEVGQASPAVQGRLAHPGFGRGGDLRRFRQQGRNQGLLLAGQFLSVAFHLLSSAFAVGPVSKAW